MPSRDQSRTSVYLPRTQSSASPIMSPVRQWNLHSLRIEANRVSLSSLMLPVSERPVNSDQGLFQMFTSNVQMLLHM